jgi:L-alanine-DL-glutamate epimerase-like enolase superfamily enzyme
MKIASIRNYPLQMSFIPPVAANMRRATTHTERVTVYRVELDNGIVGWGDSYYESDLSEHVGRHAMELLHGQVPDALRMACFDAVGKTMDVPAHVLMGEQRRPRIPFAYWTIDLPPDLLAQQIRYAADLGYRTYKLKVRPWWDVIELAECAAEHAPPGFKIWTDFNGHLRDAQQAIPILKKLQEFECIGGIESPIPQRDVPGYKRIRSIIDLPIALHYGSGCCHVISDNTYDTGVSAERQIRENLCDGFVLGGDSDTFGIDRVCYENRKVFWIQSIGTSLRAAFVAHTSSVCRQTVLSSMSGHALWEKDVVADPLAPVDGYLPVPSGPGLGIEPDEALLEELVKPEPPPEVRRISTVVYPSGVRWSFSDEQVRHEAFYFGRLPGFVRGIHLEVEDDDGSQDFDKRFTECEQTPLVTG